MKRLTLVLLALILSSCVSVGSKESLISSNNDEWREVRLFGEHFYLYECQNIEVRFYPIVVRHNINFTGLLLPIFPIMYERDNSLKGVELEFFSKGIPSQSLVDSIKLNGVATEFEVVETNMGKEKIQLLNSFLTLAEVNSVEIVFKNGSSQCLIAEFSYTKESGFWHEIVWSMGP